MLNRCLMFKSGAAKSETNIAAQYSKHADCINEVN